jgi:predicted permease
VAAIDLSIDGYDDLRGRQFLIELAQRLVAEPGVTAAGVTSDLPLDLSISESPVYVEGRSPDAEDGSMSSAFAHTDAGYFRAAGVRLLRGRVFDARDTRSSDAVVVVSRTLAERAWPGEEPIGKRVRWSSTDDAARTVVGVVADVKNQMVMEDTEPMIYLPVTQLYQPELSVVVRSSAGVAAAVAALRRVLRELDPQLSLTPPQSLASYNALGVLPQRIAALAAAAFGLLALLLSAIGIYGVTAVMVAQRTREIGVRMALGSDRRAVVRLVIWNGLRLALPGAAVGAAAGLGLGFVLRSFILGVAPTDPVALLGAPAVLLAAVLLACWLPAARAASVQPMEALRAE